MNTYRVSEMLKWHKWSKNVDRCELCGIPGIVYGFMPTSGYCVYSCCGAGGQGIIWNQTDKKWKCIDCGSVKSDDPDYYWTPKTVKEAFKPPVPKSCVCGAEKTKTTHAFWCDIKN